MNHSDTTPWLSALTEHAHWIATPLMGTGLTAPPSPMLRCGFTLSHRPAKVKLVITALGVYEPWLNGRRVGNDELQPGWFTAAEHAAKVNELTDGQLNYTVRHAAYDLKKLRGKTLLTQTHPKARRYLTTPEALRTMSGLIVLRQKIIEPLLKYLGRAKSGPVPRGTAKFDQLFRDLQHSLAQVFKELHMTGEYTRNKVLAIKAAA